MVESTNNISCFSAPCESLDLLKCSTQNSLYISQVRVQKQKVYGHQSLAMHVSITGIVVRDILFYTVLYTACVFSSVTTRSKYGYTVSAFGCECRDGVLLC